MSDIRKIQTGNNQYTLHARVTDKLAGVATYVTRNQINYPWHRIATSGTLTTKSYDDSNVVLCITEHGDPHGFGIIKINLRQNNSSMSTVDATWLLRFKFNIDDIQLGLRNTAGDTCLDVFIKTKSLWLGGVVYKINEGNRNIEKDLYKFITSEEVKNTTTTDKLTSVEVYKTIEEAATQLYGKAYTSIIKPTDVGTVANAGYSEKIGTNSSHPQIGSSTKPVYVDANGKILACSRDIPAGMAIDTELNDASTNAVLNKVINAALKGKNPKAKADFIASSDLTALPITAGVLDLNGYTLTLSGTTLLTGTLTIKNGTIGGEGTLKNDLLISINDCLLIKNSKIILSCTISLLDDIHVTDPTGNFFIFNIGENYYATISPSAYCRITNFSGITIEGTNTEYDIIAQNGTNLLVKNAKIQVLDVVAVEFLGKFNADIYNCHTVNLESSNVDQSSTYTVVSSDILRNTGSSTSTSFIRYGTKNQNGVLEDLLKPTITIDEDRYRVVSPKAVYDYLKDYAKKSDISAVYKYKGSVNKVSDLPSLSNLTESNAGDVYNIGTASSGNNITVKSGDNVAWVWDKTKNTGHWDNLSGTVNLSNYLLKGGKQTTTSTEDGGSNVYTFTDGSTITVKNGSKGSTGAAATWFSGGAVTGTSTTAKTFPVSGSKAGDMYLNTGTSNVYKATAANLWVYLCNIKGSQGTPGNNGTTPTIKAAAGGNIGAVGTPSVTANTSGTTTTFTFNNLKGQKGDTGATVTWHTGTAVTGTAATVAGAKTGDMYLNTKTYNVYKSTGTNKWVGVCNIKGANGANGTTPTIKAAAGGNINSVGTPTVSATTSGTTTTFTFNNLKGLKGETGATGATVTWHTGTAISKAGIYTITNAKLGDMYLNTTTCDVFRASSQLQAALNWVHVCNIKGAKGDAADIPKLDIVTAGIVPGTPEPPKDNLKINQYKWLNGGEDGKGRWITLPVMGAGTSGLARACKDYTSNATNPAGYGHGSTPPTIQPLTSGANDYRGVECDKQGMLFVNVPAYEKNISRAQNTVLAAPTTGTGTATFRKLTTFDIPWNELFKVMTPAQYKTATKLTNVFYFILEE